MALTKKDEFLEAAFDLGQWFETHSKTVFRAALIAVAAMILVAVLFGWRQQRVARATKVLEAGTEAFNRAVATQYNDVEALGTALALFESAEAKAGRSTPGPLATYYRGVTLFRMGRAEDAVQALESFVARGRGEHPLDWAGRGLLAQLHANLGNSARAIELLEEVSGADAAFPAEQALLQLGQIQLQAGDRDAARKSWQRVIDTFPESYGARQARELLER